VPAERHPFTYALVRVVPSLDRGECVNAGVVLWCKARDFLDARVGLDEARLRALAPDCDPAAIRPYLDAVVRVARGDAAAGPIAALPPGERFGWLAAPSSTILQPGAVHTGLCEDPAETLEALFERLVR
jgi:hypothetical protein